MSVVPQLLLAVLSSGAGTATQVDGENLVARHSYVLEFEGGKLSGPGWEFLRSAVADAQFIGLAEPHNVREIPLFAAALLGTLRESHGFDYLGCEQGPFIVELLGRAARRDGLNGLLDVARRYPEAIHFQTDQELGMIARVARIPGAPIDRVWGIDRAIATRHILARLQRSAPSDEARRAAGRALDRASEMLSVNEAGETDDGLIESETDLFDRLQATFRPAPGSEEAFLFAALQQSHRSHRTFIEASKANGLGYLHNLEREQWMKSTFLRNYRAAQAAGDPLPRVILKLGHWHMLRGWSEGNVLTLGNFLTELVRSNGLETFIINLAPINRPGVYWSLTEYPEYREVAAAGAVDRWVLVDLRPLRGPVHSGAIDVSEELERAIFGSDAFLLIGGASRGTRDWPARPTR